MAKNLKAIMEMLKKVWISRFEQCLWLITKTKKRQQNAVKYLFLPGKIYILFYSGGFETNFENLKGIIGCTSTQHNGNVKIFFYAQNHPT